MYSGGVARRLDMLTLYRAAVQHPEAEVALLMRVFGHHRGALPERLGEDFAGTAAVAGAFVRFADHHRAVAVERDAPTLQWSRRRAAAELSPDEFRRLRFVHADVRRARHAPVDLIATLNFSVGELHTRAELLAYLGSARRRLRPGGLLALDLYGGPGSQRVITQDRPFHAPDGRRLTYRWEQRSFDHATGMTRCRIHYLDARGRRLSPPRGAFNYHWRLWSIAELHDALRDAGFTPATWCDTLDPDTGQSDGHYRPVATLPAREDFVAYVVGLRV